VTSSGLASDAYTPVRASTCWPGFKLQRIVSSTGTKPEKPLARFGMLLNSFICSAFETPSVDATMVMGLTCCFSSFFLLLMYKTDRSSRKTVIINKNEGADFGENHMVNKHEFLIL
jgi:hypothetical protein